MSDDSEAVPAALEQAGARDEIVFPLVFLAIGVYCIAFPEALLDSPEYAELPKRSFGAACGLAFVASAIATHAHGYWGRRGYARVSHWGRLIGGLVKLGCIAYIFKCIIEVDSPW